MRLNQVTPDDQNYADTSVNDLFNFRLVTFAANAINICRRHETSVELCVASTSLRHSPLDGVIISSDDVETAYVRKNATIEELSKEGDVEGPVNQVALELTDEVIQIFNVICTASWNLPTRLWYMPDEDHQQTELVMRISFRPDGTTPIVIREVGKEDMNVLKQMSFWSFEELQQELARIYS